MKSEDERIDDIFLLFWSGLPSQDPEHEKYLTDRAKAQIKSLLREARLDEARINYNSVVRAIQEGRDNPDLLWQDLADPIADRIAQLTQEKDA